MEFMSEFFFLKTVKQTIMIPAAKILSITVISVPTLLWMHPVLLISLLKEKIMKS